jgi:hypothetical protein
VASGLSKNSRAEAFAVEGGQGRPATGAEQRGEEGGGEEEDRPGGFSRQFVLVCWSWSWVLEKLG